MGCAFKLYDIYKMYAVGDAENLAIKTQVLKVEDINTDFYWKYYVDFETLINRCEDVIGWIRFEEPSIISYPIVQSEDNNYYLRRNLDGVSSTFGTIFMDRYNLPDFSNSNTVLYGHNMRNGSMFGTLKNYKEKEYYDEYPYFYVYTPDGLAAKYHIFAVQEVASDSWHYTKYFNTLMDYAEYIKDTVSGSLYSTGVPVPQDGRIITLSTCTTTDVKRLIVQGLRVEERVVDYSE